MTIIGYQPASLGDECQKIRMAAVHRHAKREREPASVEADFSITEPDRNRLDWTVSPNQIQNMSEAR